MPEQDEPLSRGMEGDDKLPPIGEVVWVRCEGYRTMAYRDAKGVWRNLGNGKPLKGIIKVDWPDRQW